MSKIQPLLDFLKEVWAFNDQVKYDYLLKWLAYDVSNLQMLIGVALILLGVQGIGKTFFTDFLARFVFGEDITVQFNGISDIVDKFNLRLAGKKLSVNNETSSTR